MCPAFDKPALCSWGDGTSASERRRDRAPVVTAMMSEQMPVVTRPIKVLNVLATLQRGGIETWISQVASCIDRRFVEFDFLLYRPGQDSLERYVQRAGSRVHRLPLGEGFLGHLSFARAFRRLLRAEHYDAVHCHGTLMAGYFLRLAASERTGIRVAHCHNSGDEKGRLSRIPSVGRDLLRIWVRKYATHMIACSDEAGRYFCCDRQQHGAQIIHCGIDPSPFCVPVDREATRSEVGVPQAVPVVGHVAGIKPAKNQVFTLRIAEAVLKRRADVHFVFVGDGGGRTMLEHQVRVAGISRNVHFLGSRDDVPVLMRGVIDLLVLPSIYEGLPLTLLEAQVAGLPAVASDVVTREVEVIPGSITYISLAAGPEVWAERVLAQLTKPRPSADLAIKALRETDFWIEESSRKLSRFYAAAWSDRPRETRK